MTSPILDREGNIVVMPNLDETSYVSRGGPGSGHFGHKGRPGQVGGSQPGSGISMMAGKRRKELYGGIEIIGAFPSDMLDAVKRAIDKIPLHLRPSVRRIIYRRDWDRISHAPGSKEIWVGADNFLLAIKDGYDSRAFDGKAIVTQKQLDFERKKGQSLGARKRMLVESLRAYNLEVAIPHEIGHAVQDVIPDRLSKETWAALRRYGNKVVTHSTTQYEDYYFGPGSLEVTADLPERMVERRMQREQYAEGFRLWVTRDPAFRELPPQLKKVYTDLAKTEISYDYLSVFRVAPHSGDPETFRGRRPPPGLWDDEEPPYPPEANVPGVVERGGPGSGHFGHKGRPGEVGGSAPGTGGGKGASDTSQTRVGITSARPGKPNAQVFAEMREFSAKLKAVSGVKNPSVNPGLGGWRAETGEIVREPTWVVSYEGNGEALRLIAQTAMNADQDAVIVMGEKEDERAPMTNFYFDDRVTPAERDAIQTAAGEIGFGGWTWYRAKDGRAVMQILSVPQWGDTASHQDKVRKLETIFKAIGQPATSETKETGVTVIEREGEHAYSKILH